MYGFLGRRGFNYEVSQTAAAQVWDEAHDNSSTAEYPYEPSMDNTETEDEEVNS